MYSLEFFPAFIPDSHRYRVTNTKCRIGKVISPDDGHIVCPKHVEKSNKYRVIQNDCLGFNNLSYTIHLR